MKRTLPGAFNRADGARGGLKADAGGGKARVRCISPQVVPTIELPLVPRVAVRSESGRGRARLRDRGGNRNVELLVAPLWWRRGCGGRESDNTVRRSRSPPHLGCLTTRTQARGIPERSGRRSHGRIGPPTRYRADSTPSREMCVPMLAAEADCSLSRKAALSRRSALTVAPRPERACAARSRTRSHSNAASLRDSLAGPARARGVGGTQP
jgi:hypothetical protein